MFNRIHVLRWCIPLILASLWVGFAGQALLAQDAARIQDRGDGESKPVDASWQENLNRADREALDAAIGFAPPAFAPTLEWVGSAPLTWPSLRGKVVVIQSWTSATAAGRREPVILLKALGELNAAEVQPIALHTPDNADKAATYLERQPIDMPVAIDSTGECCDGLGIYKRPVNVVVDRNGTVRYAGLNSKGLKEAVTMLLAERMDPSARPVERAASEAPGSSSFPQISGEVRSAADRRGQKAPDFFVAQWINERPDDPRKGGQVLVLDFWATWCGPCVASIPHMNELSDGFRGKVVCVGISDESPSDFDSGLKQRKLDLSSFKYHLALDPKATLKSFFGVRGIPNVAVISSDWVVRWQGHPQDLTRSTLEQIVKANDALVAGKGAKPGSKGSGDSTPGEPPRRWQSERR